MKNIQTLNNEVSVDQLGFTLIHEHLLFQFDEKFKEKSIDFTRKELIKLKGNGGKTVVDLTPFKKIHWLKEIAKEIDLNLLCCTGYYIEDVIKNFSSLDIFHLDSDRHSAFMEKEILEGIEDTKIKAAIIKVAGAGYTLTPWEEAVFTAAAKAQIKTKTPIATHACTGAAEQQRVLLKAGANPDYIFFSHIEAKFGWEGRNLKQQCEHLLNIVKEGSYLLFNNFGFEFDTPKDEIIYILKYLSDKGYMNNLLISVDMNYQVNEEGSIILEAADGYPECEKRVYSYLLTDVVPVLKAAGFSSENVDTLFVKNPMRFFNYL